MKMRQQFFSILFTILISMVAINAFAYDIAVENEDGVTIYYNYINDGRELEVTKGLGYQQGIIVIPSEVTYMNRTREVTSIGEYALYNCSGLTSVTIPNSVTTIGFCAFKDCNRLTSVTIGNSVITIGSHAFDGCSGLTSVTIPNSVTTIGDSAFRDCIGLTSITIPSSVTTISGFAFNNCRGLKSVTIPNSVTTIGNYTFGGCSGLTTITIPNSVTTIVAGAFSGCSGLTSVTIPNSVKEIGGDAFGGCKGLTSITIGNNVTYIGDKAFDNSDITTVISLIENPFGIYGKIDEHYRTFSLNTFNNATLYVPKGTIEKYKTTKGWKDFLFIEEGDGGSTPPEIPKCATPTIGYNKGKLTYNCDTEGAVCQTTITDTDITSFSGNEIDLTVTYNISVYATKAGYENSDVATATLCWIDVDPKTDGITNVTHVEARAVMIKTDGGQLSIEGADDSTDITAYTLDGVQLGSAVSRNGLATINTNVSEGTVTIVKIGNKSVKVVMR